MNSEMTNAELREAIDRTVAHLSTSPFEPNPEVLQRTLEKHLEQLLVIERQRAGMVCL